MLDYAQAQQQLFNAKSDIKNHQIHCIVRIAHQIVIHVQSMILYVHHVVQDITLITVYVLYVQLIIVRPVLDQVL